MPGTLTRWDPFTEFADLRTRFDRMLHDLGETRERVWVPAIDLVRNDDCLVLRADIPGITPEEVKIEVENDMLTVSGSHEETTESKDEEYMRRERRYGSFYRSVTLPSGVDPKSITAVTRDGVLEVTVPLPSEDTPEKVEITATAG